MSRPEAARAAAAVIARHVPNLAELAALLDAGGFGRLGDALRVLVAARAVDVGSAKPDPAVWREACERMLGGAR